MRVVDVPAETVTTPGRRHELHRPLGTGGARTAKLPELRLDEVDGGEHVPRYVEAALSLPVVPEELAGRTCATDLDPMSRDRRSQAVELALRGKEIASDHGERPGKPRNGEPGEAPVSSEKPVDPLLVERQEFHCSRGRSGLR